jgi:hypothetical protein
MRHRGFQAQFGTYVIAMMADNIEHVIGYWMLFQKFSPSCHIGCRFCCSRWQAVQLPAVSIRVASSSAGWVCSLLPHLALP